jgi:hypothetical protein
MSGTQKRNAKKELLSILGDSRPKCAVIQYMINFDEIDKLIILKCGYTEDEWNIFLDRLDFEYSTWNEVEYLNGTIWMLDGTWYERMGFTAPAYWEHLRLPIIPKLLIE